jgi:cation transport regulator ChaB
VSGQEAADVHQGLTNIVVVASAASHVSWTEEHAMPKTTSQGTAKKSELPSTLQKSSAKAQRTFAKAQRTFAKAHDAAVKEYGQGRRAHRVAYSALKYSFEKVGDHWEAKSEKGPSDARARSGGPNPRGRSAEGVNANASKQHLMDIAKRLDITGRSTMTKAQLVRAIEKANRNATARNR